MANTSDHLQEIYQFDLLRREIEIFLNRGDGDADYLRAAITNAGTRP
jgi:hypothetical protein